MLIVIKDHLLLLLGSLVHLQLIHLHVFQLVLDLCGVPNMEVLLRNALLCSKQLANLKMFPNSLKTANLRKLNSGVLAIESSKRMIRELRFVKTFSSNSTLRLVNLIVKCSKLLQLLKQQHLMMNISSKESSSQILISMLES